MVLDDLVKLIGLKEIKILELQDALGQRNEEVLALRKQVEALTPNVKDISGNTGRPARDRGSRLPDGAGAPLLAEVRAPGQPAADTRES